jgi:hypothetical protein
MRSEEVVNHEGAIFMQYHYEEVKDLAKTFLTLVSAVLVVSLTFSEKIIDFPKASATQRLSLVATWVLFITSIIFCGVALCFLASAGGQAVFGDAPWYSPSNGEQSGTRGNGELVIRNAGTPGFVYPAMLANLALLAAGASFVSGLATLIFAATLAAWQRKAPDC